MRVLVTGATGFLGSWVVEQLLARCHGVRALVRPGRPRKHLEGRAVELVEGDVLDYTSLFGACRGMDGLVHCAARRGFWSRQDDEQRSINVEGSSALYRAARLAKVARIVHVSSFVAVGVNQDGAPLTEETPWPGRVIDANYVFTKRESEERAFVAIRGGMPITIVNPAMIVGPRLDGKPPSALVRRIARGELRWIPQGGTAVCDVEDVAVGIASALERGRVGERYLLGGHNLTWGRLYAGIAEQLGVRAPRRVVPDIAAVALARGAGLLDFLRLSRPPWTPEIFRSWGWYAFVDSAKAEGELGYRVRPLAEMLRRMVADGAGVRAPPI